MNTDADKFWESFAAKLRKYEGLCPLTPQEAEEALRAIPKRPVSDEEIDSIVDAALHDEIPKAEPEVTTDWSPTFDLGEMNREALALYRSQGSDGSDTDDVEEELRQELLDDDEPEEDGNGMGG